MGEVHFHMNGFAEIKIRFDTDANGNSEIRLKIDRGVSRRQKKNV